VRLAIAPVPVVVAVVVEEQVHSVLVDCALELQIIITEVTTVKSQTIKCGSITHSFV
jgi:hypothetical protein